jgi:hypothetical protein
MYDSIESRKVLKTKQKKARRDYHLFLPPLLSLTELSIELTGQRAQHAFTTRCTLLYTYLFKNVLHHQDQDTERWVEISRRSLRTMLGTKYCQVVDDLIKHDYLERLECNSDGAIHKHNRGHYWNYTGKPGECKKYRIPSRLLSPDKLFSVSKQPVTTLLTNKITALNAPVGAEIERYREMALFNMSDVILLDTPACRAVLDELYAELSITLTPDDYIEFFNHYVFAAPVVCDFGHRAHHRVVRVHHRLRPFLRFRDALTTPLVELDFVASQPTLLANITPALIKKYAPECSEALPLFTKYGPEKDYKEYQQLCFDGLIYEHLRDKFNARYITSITRDDAKNICYIAFFSNYDYRDAARSQAVTEERLRRALLGSSDAEVAEIRETLFKKRSYELFKELFQNVHALFMDIKQLDWSSFNPGGKHANNCLLAQRIESGLIYTCFVKAMVAAGITRFTTTHDAINVQAPDEEKARRIIEKEVRKAGLKLNLKTKTPEAPASKSVEPIPVDTYNLDALLEECKIEFNGLEPGKYYELLEAGAAIKVQDDFWD